MRVEKPFSICFNTQPPEGGWLSCLKTTYKRHAVSTHSRPKAAGTYCQYWSDIKYSFNTQPPEGGWVARSLLYQRAMSFQHTAARRRLGILKK